MDKTLKNCFIRLFTSVVFVLMLFSSCQKQTESLNTKGNSQTGVITGKISIGPLCPVETVPPSPGCQPTAETYKAWSTAVWSTDKKIKIAVIMPSLDGHYAITLPPNDYVLDFDSMPNTTGIGSSNLPHLFTILANDTITFDVNIDTGIR